MSQVIGIKRYGVEVTTTWSDTTLDVRQLELFGDRPRANGDQRSRLTVGEGKKCDVWLSSALIGGTKSLAIVERDKETVRLRCPLGATLAIEGEQDDDSSLALVHGPEGEIILPTSELWTAWLTLGDIEFRIRTMPRVAYREPPRPRDWPMLSLVALSVILHAAILLVADLAPPSPKRITLDLVEQEDRFVRYLLSPSEVVAVETQARSGSSVADNQGGRGRRHRGEEGSMGRVAARSDNRYGIRGPADRSRPLEYASAGGLPPFPPGAFPSSSRIDPSNALGALALAGSSSGYGTLGVRGTGRGGGGAGDSTIGLGQLNSIGRANMPRNGVLASSFVAGRGVEARLTDLLDRGVLIDGENVRLQAFEERGRLPYPIPTNEAVALYAELERGRIVTAGDSTHLQIALVAREDELPRRPQMDVRLVMDRSGSMNGEKWDSAIAAAHQLVDRLHSNDSFGLISYSDEATLDVAPQAVGNGRAIHEAIDRLEPGGSTNLSAALELARANAPRRENPRDAGLVMVISDGVANVGLTDSRDLGGITRGIFDTSGAITTAIGLGTSFDEQTMLTIAREGNGSYHFVRRPADIGDILHDELDERSQAVAQALRVRVVLADGVSLRRVYGSRLLDEQEHMAVRASEVAVDARLAEELGIVSDREQENEEGLRIHIGSFRRSDQHVILMELDVPPGQVGDETQVARVYLEYKDLASRSNEETSVAVSAERVEDRSQAVASLRRSVKRTVLAFQAGEALQFAAESLRLGDAARARAILAERRELLRTASTLWRDPSLRADARLIGRYESVLASAYPSWSYSDQRTLLLAMNNFADRRMR